MRVLERFMRGKDGSDTGGEDAIVVTPAYAAVLDGATAKTTRRYDGRTPGAHAGRVLAAGIVALPDGADAVTAVRLLSERLAASLGAHGPTEVAPHERPAAAAAVYSAARRELWLVGDCQALVGDRLVREERPLEGLMVEVRSAVLALARTGGTAVDDLLREDPGRAFILPLLRLQARLQNTPDAAAARWRHAALDGTPVHPDDVRVVPVPPGVDRLALASDGYPVVRPSLAECEAELAALLAEDPLCCRRHLATKGRMRGQVSYDDRAYLLLAL